MGINERHLDRIVEPVADPTRPAPPEKVRFDHLPIKPAPPPIAPKVSPRRDYLCDVTIDGITYGPFTQNAVDESEAIQRIQDANPAMKKHSWKHKWIVRPASDAPAVPAP